MGTCKAMARTDDEANKGGTLESQNIKLYANTTEIVIARFPTKC